MTPTTFRTLLIASIAIGLLGGLLDDIIPSLLPQPAADARGHEPSQSGATLVVLGIGVLFLVIGGLLASVGLFFFRAWARVLAVAVTACSLLVWPLLDVTVASGWSMALTDLSSTLWGAVLAVAYFSPLGDRFTGVGANNSFKPKPLRGSA